MGVAAYRNALAESICEKERAVIGDSLYNRVRSFQGFYALK